MRNETIQAAPSADEASLRWNKLVKESDHSKIYQLRQWGRLLTEVHGHKLVYLQEEDGVFPLAEVSSPIFGKRLISTPFADYGGPCARSHQAAERLIVECQKAAQELDVDFVEIRCPDSRYFEIFDRHGFVRKDDYFTFVMSLDSTVDELYKAIGDKNRNMIRKAERGGVEIIEAQGKTDLSAFFQVYQKTMKKLGSPPQPYRFFERLWELFYPSNLLMPLARHNGRCVAGGIFFLHNNLIHHAYGCSQKEYLQLAPNNLIQWYVIKWGSEHGFRSLDFGRTRADEGTELFKKRWGGERVRMPYFYKFYRKQLSQRQEIKYRALSKAWAWCVPEWAANRVGPWVVRQIG